jgi:N4-gp56 family major capsid protein
MKGAIMSIANFVPELWSTRVLRHLDANLVYAQPTCINSEYEGEISQQGDTVHIQKFGNVTVKPYTKGTPIDGPEQATSSTVPLVIDQAHYWNLGVKSVDAAQANLSLLEPRLARAGVALSTVVDAGVAAKMVAGAGIYSGLGTSAVPLDIGNAGADDYTVYELAVEMRRKLDNAKAPDVGRWFVIPPDLESSVLLDPNFVPAGAAEQRTGKIGQIAGFDVLKTTAVPTITKTGAAPYDSWAVLFGADNYATTHAHQLTDLRAYEVEADFEDAVKSLAVWGTKVVEPETLGLVTVSKGA